VTREAGFIGPAISAELHLLLAVTGRVTEVVVEALGVILAEHVACPD
jgi:hypothetical protein